MNWSDAARCSSPGGLPAGSRPVHGGTKRLRPGPQGNDPVMLLVTLDMRDCVSHLTLHGAGAAQQAQTGGQRLGEQGPPGGGTGPAVDWATRNLVRPIVA